MVVCDPPACWDSLCELLTPNACQKYQISHLCNGIGAKLRLGALHENRKACLQPATHLSSPRQPLPEPFFSSVYCPSLSTGLVQVINKEREEQVNCLQFQNTQLAEVWVKYSSPLAFIELVVLFTLLTAIYRVLSTLSTLPLRYYMGTKSCLAQVMFSI